MKIETPEKSQEFNLISFLSDNRLFPWRPYLITIELEGERHGSLIRLAIEICFKYWDTPRNVEELVQKLIDDINAKKDIKLEEYFPANADFDLIVT